MEHPLDGARAKASRAKTHLDALESKIEAFVKADVYTITQDNTGQYGQLVVQRRADLPLDWGLIVGDFAHNLRTALDYIAWELNLCAGRTVIETQCCFPICDSTRSYRSARNNFPNKPIGVRRLVENFQPYHRRNHPKLELLSIIRELDDTDKHRTITPVLDQAQLAFANPILNTDTSSSSPSGLIFDLNESGYTAIITNGFQPQLGSDINPIIATQIIFKITNRITKFVYRVEQRRLHEIYELVHDIVIPSFARFFIRTKSGWATRRVRHLSTLP